MVEHTTIDSGQGQAITLDFSVRGKICRLIAQIPTIYPSTAHKHHFEGLNREEYYKKHRELRINSRGLSGVLMKAVERKYDMELINACFPKKQNLKEQSND